MRATRARVLIVDDELRIGESLRRALGEEHHVAVAGGAREAMSLLSGDVFDLVLCDLMMPETTGMDLHAELMRTMPEVAARMVFMTGGAFTRTAREFLARVPNRCIDKPIEMDNLRGLIREMSETAGRKRAAV